jgi:hypothetical protein
LKRKGLPIAQAVFHRCSDKSKSIADEAKMSILTALGVDVIDHVGTSYAEAYDKCIASFC